MTAPFMHGAAQWSSFHMISTGGKIVLPEDVHHMDAADWLRTTEREGVMSIPVVGDAMARPLVEELERGDYDMSGLAAINNGGAPISPGVRHRIHEALPNILILDAVGSSETGIQMNHYSAAGAEAETAVFNPEPSTTVVDDEHSRALQPGEGGGWLARSGLVPLGYLGDAEKDRQDVPGHRRRALLGARRSCRAARRRPDPAPRPGRGHHQLRRREDLRRGGRAGTGRAPRHRRRDRRRPAVRALGQRG